MVTHKLDDDKKAKIRRLAIDTIQIIIPKDSPENIAKSLETSKNTKWIFNNVEQNTESIQLSARDSEAILPIDAVEMGFFRESVGCRENQIRNLIRSITKCLESEQYQQAERRFKSEISRVAENTIGNQNRLDDLRKQYSGRAQERYRDSLEEISQAESLFAEVETGELNRILDDFNDAKSQRESNFNDLESRYLRKRAEIEGRRNQVKINITQEERFIEERTGIGNKPSTIRRATARIQKEIESLDQSRIELKRKFDEYGTIEQSRYSTSSADIRGRINSIKEEFKRKEKEFTRRLEFEEAEIIRSIARAERELRIDPEKYRERTIQLFEGTYIERSKLPDRFAKLFEARSILNDWNEKQNTLNRNRAALECFNSGTYKKWH